MVEENKQLQAKTLGLLHACEEQGSKPTFFPKSDGWCDDEMANILFAFMLKYPMPTNNVAISFSNQDPDGTIAIVVNHQKFFTFNVSRARDRVATIFEKSKILITRRNNSVGATPPGEAK